MEYILNDNWHIISGNDNESVDYHKTGIPRKDAVTAQLPCYAHMYLEDHVGISWWEKEFIAEKIPEENEIALLCFEQAVFRTDVSVNGETAGIHTGVEDPFCFDITDLLKQNSNRITVRISKPHTVAVDGYSFAEVPHRNQCTTGMRPGTCYNESGICGTVSLKILPRIYIENIYAVPDVKTGKIGLEIRINNKYSSGTASEIICSARRSPSGETTSAKSFSVTLTPGINTVQTNITIDEYELWSTDNPVLYSVNVSVNNHSAVIRTGFRSFEVKDDGYFYLNDNRIFLKCTHTGNCMPLSTHHISYDKELLRKDFIMAKAMGFNMVRFIAGAALPFQLDLCDEIGLMVYEEPTSGWLTRNGIHAKENFRHNMLTMVQRDRNHPSITVWGLLNETTHTNSSDLYEAARDILPDLRKEDATRLVIFSSGRWDKLLSNGSVCNPYKDKWEFLWNGDGTSDKLDDEYYNDIGFGQRPGFEVGDVHFYSTTIPHSKRDTEFLRTVGCLHKKPVFISETGIGSVLDTISLVNRFEQDNASDLYPDVKMIHKMNNIFCDELKKYGFDTLYPLASQLIDGSMKNHAKYRENDFNIIRSNPYVNGLSLTGMLDHSICGEGLWTLYRKFKPGMAEVLENGFYPLMWCLLPSTKSLFKGEVLETEALLSDEDRLVPGKQYNVRATISGNGRVYCSRDYTFTANTEKSFVTPVFCDTFDTSGLADGCYTFKVEIAGADAAGGTFDFSIHTKAVSTTKKSIYCINVCDCEKAKLKQAGFDISDSDNCTTVVTGLVTPDNFEEIKKLLSNGKTVICLKALQDNDISVQLLPESRRPSPNLEKDWLYHRETAVNYNSAFFNNLPAGTMDADLFGDIFTGTAYDAENGQIPDITHAIAFSMGYPNSRGYTGGFKLGTYITESGTLVLNTFNLLNSSSPSGLTLLINIIDNA